MALRGRRPGAILLVATRMQGKEKVISTTGPELRPVNAAI
jgi:hypothetical protein